MVVTAWSVYAALLVAIAVTEPTAAICVRRLDESGKTIWLRRPVVGWKSTEMIVGMDELASGTYDWDHGIEDVRFRDVSISSEIYRMPIDLMTRRDIDMATLSFEYEATVSSSAKSLSLSIQRRYYARRGPFCSEY